MKKEKDKTVVIRIIMVCLAIIILISEIVYYIELCIGNVIMEDMCFDIISCCAGMLAVTGIILIIVEKRKEKK